MPIKLEHIVGYNYFAIFPKDKYDALSSIAGRANALQSERLASNEAEARLLGLQGELGDCIGIIEAEKLESFAGIGEAALEKKSRLEGVKRFHDYFFQQAIKAAEAYVKNDTEFSLEEEIQRDYIFHVLARSGILEIPRHLGRDVKEENVAQSISHGDNLGKHLPEEFEGTDIKLFVLGMKNSAMRGEFLESIKIRYEFAEDDLENIWKNLQKRFGNISYSQLERIGIGLMYLWSRNGDLQHIFSENPLNKSLIPLAFLISQNFLKERNVTYYHTPTSRYVKNIEIMMKGELIIRQEILKFLSELTGIDGFEHATVWRAHKYDIVNPTREIPDDIWGELYGIMLARLSGDKLILHNITVEEVQSCIERLGRLNKKLEVGSVEISTDKLYRHLGIENRYINTYKSNYTTIPQQVINLTKSVNPQEVTPEFAKYALSGYAMLRGTKSFSGYELHIPFGDEDIVRALVAKAGVSMGVGTHRGRLLRTYMSGLRV